ncbi:SigE family RNA polymerase sigma factor [Spongisporangium articulatum]|uniref:SigE family RNA polymerase sigma factor n=1 Tax=Spongisporangium articulatum TaxID=3362603 RepID=A0ABW8AJG7_9ACTN
MTPEQVVATRGPALLRLAWLLTADGPAAEDLVQEAFARALPRWSSIGAGRHEAYLRTTIRSVWIDSLRRRAARVVLDVVPEPPETPQPDGDLERAPARLAVQQALKLLSVRQRTVLVLRYYEDLTEAETARLMRISVGTVKSQAHHALARLRALAPELAELLVEPPDDSVRSEREVLG